MNRLNKKGFTLLEIIIVIIIVGVLASLALPRLFSTVEYSRSTEAFISIAAIREAMERCSLYVNSYASCNQMNLLDLEDPTNSPNAHFSYSITTALAKEFEIKATRLSRDGGVIGEAIFINQAGNNITRRGTPAFRNIK